MDSQERTASREPSNLLDDRIPDLWVELLSERILAELVPQQRVRS